MFCDPVTPHKIRRRLLAVGGALGMLIVVRPVFATPEERDSAIKSFTGGALVKVGKVTLDVPMLVDNGNAVPVTVTVDSPMNASEHVTAIAIFNERNPQPEVARFSLGPRAGKASVSTRMRLATSQKLIAVAKLNDGTFWSHSVEVVVTLAACIEGES
ncbi:SoxY-related AACIE arm protein [Noviherbaspirillum sp. Root189]|uniref:SoxY-related AACIE arm protein n=1 Tax=Noviherbaspirillum sp. Root189 TaxID=1736487 RepID=UPI00070E3BAE|nr:SoxY-related AACIE arm protein [Noviherbaspirillum sp. Root189]KRB68040.1 sulfur oxidation protein SoxY [Noviherbaspirillum sp. Root189]